MQKCLERKERQERIEKKDIDFGSAYQGKDRYDSVKMSMVEKILLSTQ